MLTKIAFQLKINYILTNNKQTPINLKINITLQSSFQIPIYDLFASFWIF